MIAKLPPMDRRSISSVLTHVVSKTFAGIGVLDFLHNGSVAFLQGPASYDCRQSIYRDRIWIGKLLQVIGSFSGCLVYDPVALAVGQRGDWRTLLNLYAVGAASIVTAKNLAR